MQGKPAASFTDLVVWQKSHLLTLKVYRVSARYPKTELYGLVSQMRRAAASVPANIAEGFKRASRPRRSQDSVFCLLTRNCHVRNRRLHRSPAGRSAAA